MADRTPSDPPEREGAPLTRRARREAERAARLEAERLEAERVEAEERRAETAGAASGGAPTPVSAPAGPDDDAGPPPSHDAPPDAGAHQVPPVQEAEPGQPVRLLTDPQGLPVRLVSDMPAEPLPQPSRAGRNLPVAIGVGLGLAALIVASLLIRKEVFVAIAVVACLLGLWELARAVRTRDVHLPLLPLAVGTVGILVSAYTAGIEALLVAFVLTAGGVFVWRVLDGGGLPALRDATAGIFAAAYVPFLAGFIMIMLSADDGPWRVLMFIALVVSNDTGGYAAGVLFGKHPMAPSVSPKKSWEGAVGSATVAAVTGALFAHFALDVPWWAGVCIGLVAVVGATVGDLAESLLKRDLGVKDMGTLLPGHGGVLDRVDSILVCAPIVFAVLLVVAPA